MGGGGGEMDTTLCCFGLICSGVVEKAESQEHQNRNCIGHAHGAMHWHWIVRTFGFNV